MATSTTGPIDPSAGAPFRLPLALVLGVAAAGAALAIGIIVWRRPRRWSGPVTPPPPASPSSVDQTPRVGPDPLAGRRASIEVVPSGYEIVGEPKRGGMACVYRAYQVSLDRHVAVKVMAPALASDPSFVQKFSEEARRTAKLEHPNIVTIYDSGQLPDGSLFIAMRYIDGTSLQELLAREGALPVARAVGIVDQVAAALGFAHARGIVHRDVKPSNVMVEPGDRITLTDFGIAKAIDETQLAHSSVVGTPKYLAPEQALAQPVDQRTDLYSLGVMLYEMLVGRAPFEAETPYAMLNAHISLMPPPPTQVRPELSEEVAAVVMKAMAKDRAQRFQSAADLAQALRRANVEETQAI